MIIKYNILFRLFPYGKNRNHFQIRMRVSFLGNRVDVVTGCRLGSLESWDAQAGLVRGGDKQVDSWTASSMNDALRRCRDTMQMVFKYFEVNEISPSVSAVKKEYASRMRGGVHSSGREADFFSLFDDFLASGVAKNAWSHSTICRMRTFRKTLQAFDGHLTLISLDEERLVRFVGWLRGSLSNSTIAKKLEHLRWFLHWAEDKGLAVNPAYKTFRPALKQVRRTIVYLSQDDLTKIHQLVLYDPSLIRIRDIFLFCCFSGLRYSDVNNLRRSDIIGDYIKVTTIKTADTVSIELNDITRSILFKYRDADFPGGKALPSYSNQLMNRRLKELCRLAGLNGEVHVVSYRGGVREDHFLPKWQLVCTHTGRRTFIVQALSMGIPPNIVMKWTGHSSYKAMMPYIDIVDSAKAESMTRFNSLLDIMG